MPTDHQTLWTWPFWYLAVCTGMILYAIMTNFCQYECRRTTFFGATPGFIFLRCFVYCNCISLAFAAVSIARLGVILLRDANGAGDNMD